MPPKKKTIQDIKPSKKVSAVRKKVAKTKKEAVEALHMEGLTGAPVKRKARAKKALKKTDPKKNRGIWILVVAVFVFFLFAFSLLFSGSTVILTPKQVALPEAKVMLTGEKDSTEGLSFQTISVEGDRSTQVLSNEALPVNRQAHGTVTLYNNNSTKQQNLLIDTRLLGSNGQIYKTKKAISIPGQTQERSELIPGHIDVEVYADTPGNSGNLDLSDFSVVGFKGTSREHTIYGRSKTKITGGFTGSLYSLSMEVSETELGKLRELLKSDLLSKLSAQVPDGYHLVDNGTEYSPLEKTRVFESDTEMVEVYEKAQITGIIIDKSILAESLARETLVSYVEGSGILINNIESLVIALVDSPIGLELINKASISILGKPKLIWSLDEDKIKYDLIGIRKKQFDTVMARYEYIDKAKLRVTPFWQSKLPESIEDINIEYDLD
jgi:hypothetical protein